MDLEYFTLDNAIYNDLLNDHGISAIIKNWIRDLIGLAANAYGPLYHSREIATIKLSSGGS